MKTIFYILFITLNLSAYAQFQENIIDAISYPVKSIVSVDIDNDNDYDLVVTGGIDNQMSWIENSNGLGSFDIVHQIISIPANMWGGAIAISDIDGDDDVDILVTSSELDCGEIYTFRNTDGSGSFEFVSSSMNTCGSQSPIRVGDIDGDTYPDWVSSFSASELNDHKLSWFKNDGTGDVVEQYIEETYLKA